MSIVIINPNSTSSMTAAMVEVARAAAPDLSFEGWTSHDGPPAIQGEEDGKAAAAPLLTLVRKASDSGAAGIIIGCFDDTCLSQAAELATCPVIGIGQAAYHHAALRQQRFSVVTTLSVSVPILQRNIHGLGLGQYLGRVRASDVPVLALEEDPAAATQKVLKEARAAQAQDDVQAVILGCAGMVQVVEEVRRNLKIDVIDPVVSAATCFRWLVPASAP